MDKNKMKEKIKTKSKLISYLNGKQRDDFLEIIRLSEQSIELSEQSIEMQDSGFLADENGFNLNNIEIVCRRIRERKLDIAVQQAEIRQLKKILRELA